MARLRAAWHTHAVVGWAVAPRTRTRRVACSMTARTYLRAPVSVVVAKKSAAMIAWAWARRNVAQVSPARWGAGSMPASWRISQTVEAATLTPNTSGSPWILRYPHVLFSRAGAARGAGLIGGSVAARPAWAGRSPRAGGRSGRGASAVWSRGAPATGCGAAPGGGVGAAGRRAMLGQQG
jgi:hypothetical protein